MKLYMSMLYHQLGKKHRVEYNHKKFADKVSLECPMYLSAETLFIHRTTLISRLKKIQKLYPVDLEDPQTVHHLILSFALLGVEN